MSGLFEFTELRLNTPSDNICAAVSIIQSHILAADTCAAPEVMFGNRHYRTDDLRTAVALLVPLVDDTERLRWGPPARPVK